MPMGVNVEMCGHSVVLPCDVYEVAGAVVVRTSGVKKSEWHEFHRKMRLKAEYHLSDFPKTGFWRDDLGVYVVPAAQLTKTKGAP